MTESERREAERLASMYEIKEQFRLNDLFVAGYAAGRESMINGWEIAALKNEVTHLSDQREAERARSAKLLEVARIADDAIEQINKVSDPAEMTAPLIDAIEKIQRLVAAD